MPKFSPDQIVETIRKRPGLTVDELIDSFPGQENAVLIALEQAYHTVYREEKTGRIIPPGRAEKRLKRGDRTMILSYEGQVEPQLDADKIVRLVIRDTSRRPEEQPVIDPAETLASAGENTGISNFAKFLHSLGYRKR